jgi:hypothetical protein
MNRRLENLITYMSHADPLAVNRLAYKYGFIAPVSAEGRQGLLIRGIQEGGDEFIRDMAKMHPDRELIMNADGSETPISIQSTSAPSSNTPGNSNSDLIRVIILLVVAYILYKMIS